MNVNHSYHINYGKEVSVKSEALVIAIILNYNKKNDLLECLESLYKQDYKNIEIIIVDNGSEDGSVDEVKIQYPGVYLIENKVNMGVAGGRNIGISFANEKFNYEYILFLDNDMTLEKGALTEMINTFNMGNDIGIVTPKCYMTAIQNTIANAGGMYVSLTTGKIADIGNGELDIGQYDKLNYVPASCGSGSVVLKGLIDKIGVFDEKFNPYGWEDVDLSLRARKKNFKILFNYKAVVYHKGGKIGRGGALSDYESSKTKNYFYLIRKHANIFQLILISFLLPFKVVLLIIRELLNQEYKIVFAQFRGLLNILK